MKSSRLAALTIASSLSWARVAAAQRDPWALSWNAPRECPSESSLRAQVATTVGAVSTSSPVRMTVTVSSSPRWRAEIITDSLGTRGERVLDADSCRELADAVVVILAWMIDPSMQPSPVASEPVLAPSSANPPVASAPVASTPVGEPESDSPAPVVTPAPAAEPRPRSAIRIPVTIGNPWRFRLGVGARADLGALPGFAVGAELQASLTRGRWRLSVDGSWRPTARRELSTTPSLGGEFGLWTVGVGACHRWVLRPVTPAVCANVEGGITSATGFGVSRPGGDQQPWAAASAGAMAELPIGQHLALTARAALEVPLVRPRFVLEGVGEVFQPSAAGLRAAIGMEVVF